jgi:ankyrin repeat protein
MRRLLFAALLAVPFWGAAQSNTMLSPDFWKGKPGLEAVKAEIAKGNSPSAANRANYDVVSLAINNDAPVESIKYLIEQPGNSVNKKTHDGRTYLHWAAMRGNAEVVNYLIEKGADVNFGDDRGTIPVVFGAGSSQANPEVYEAFFKAGINPKQKYQNGANLLLLSIANDKDLKLADYLVSKGLSYKDKDDLGRTAFDYAARSGNINLLKKLLAKGVKPTNQALLIAAQGSRGSSVNLEAYQYLVEEIKIPAAATNENGENVLHALVRKPNQEAIIDYFLSKGVDINKADKEGNTAFMNAAGTRNIALVKSLAARVKNINQTNHKGETALTAAVHNGSPEVVAFLIEKGSNTAVQTKDGNLGYYLVQSFRQPRPGETGDDFDKKLEILSKAGYNLATPQPNGNTLYHLAVGKNDLNLIKKLAPFKININAKNAEGLTALHRAALLAKDDAILKYLVSLGADKSIQTDMDETAFDLAKENESLAESKISIDFLK